MLACPEKLGAANAVTALVLPSPPATIVVTAAQAMAFTRPVLKEFFMSQVGADRDCKKFTTLCPIK
jgi:hypothetical protein